MSATEGAPLPDADETAAPSEAPVVWLTIAQAGQRLGISERQARRYAARLGDDDRQEPDNHPGASSGTSGPESGDSPAPSGPKRPALVRLEAMQALRDASKTAHSLSGSTPDTLQAQAVTTPDTLPYPAGHAPDSSPIEATTSAGLGAGHTTGPTPDTADNSKDAQITQMLYEQRERDRKEIEFLRGLIEQRDRDAAELRATLRKLVEAQPKQLGQGGEIAPVSETEPSATPAQTQQPVRQNAAGIGPEQGSVEPVKPSLFKRWFGKGEK